MMPPVNGIRDSIKMIYDGLHSYVDIEKLKIVASPSCTLSGCPVALNTNPSILNPWSQTKGVIDKVHPHVGGHSSYSDIEVLLQRKTIWTEEVLHYLSILLENVLHARFIHSTSCRKVALGKLNSSLNDVVMIDYFYLDENSLFHFMDSYLRSSTVYLVPDATLFSAVVSFESTCITPFWSPDSVQGDQASLRRNKSTTSTVMAINVDPFSLGSTKTILWNLRKQ